MLCTHIGVLFQKQSDQKLLILQLRLQERLRIFFREHLRHFQYLCVYFFHFRVPCLVERGNIGYFLLFFLRLFLFTAFYGIELYFFFLCPTSAENIEYIFVLIEQPRFAF